MRFEKVSFDQYMKDSSGDVLYTKDSSILVSEILEGKVTLSNQFTCFNSKSMKDIYEEIKLPKRATKKSAGYDFFSPYDFDLAPGQTIKLATGIRVILDDDKYLMCAPRSGHGFKARIQLDNTIGIIDADYSDSDNEGHIHIKLTNDSHTNKYVHVNIGDGIIQAIINKYFIVEDDDTTAVRNGGFGSTTNKEC